MRSKRYSSIQFSCLILLGWLSAFSAWAGEDRGLIWEVTDGNEAKVWLLGSVHFAEKSLYPMRPAIEQAFEQAQQLVVEVDVDAIPAARTQAILQEKSLYPDGETLREHVSAETVKAVEARLRTFGVPLEAVERQKPAFLALTLTSLKLMQLGYDSSQGIDHYFLAKARRTGKPIQQIETLESQLDLLDHLGPDELVAQQAVVSFDETEEFMKATMEAWKQGDAERLAREVIQLPLQRQPEFKPIYERLFFNRNPAMAAKVEQCLKQRQQCFVVVGAGHLVGKNSVVEHLQKAGYKVTQQ